MLSAKKIVKPKFNLRKMLYEWARQIYKIHNLFFFIYLKISKQLICVIFYIFFEIMLYPSIILAQDVGSSAGFLNLPHNVSEYSAGNSASLLGLDGVYTNPASTTLPKNSAQYYMESSVSVSQFLGDVSFSNISFLYWLGDNYGTLGGIISFLHYGDIPIVDANGSSQGETSAYDFSGGLNYSRKIFYDILIGVNLKVIQQKLYIFNTIGFASDFGLKKKINLQNNELWLSLSGNNFGPKITFEVEGSLLPSSINGSTSFVLRKWLPRWFSVEIGPQFNYFLEGHYDFTLGGEFLFDFHSFNLYGLIKHKYNSANQNQISFGIGGGYRFYPYHVNISFGMDPLQERSDFITSIKFIYDFGVNKLPKVEAINLDRELNLNNSKTSTRDFGEIIIQLDEPIFEDNDNKIKKEEK